MPISLLEEFIHYYFDLCIYHALHDRLDLAEVYWLAGRMCHRELHKRQYK